MTDHVKNAKTTSVKSKAVRPIALAAALAAAGIIGYGAGSTSPDIARAASNPFAENRQESTEIEPVAPSNAPASFADVVERVGPAVVSVRVTQKAEAGPASGMDLPPGHPLERFFKEFGAPNGGGNQPAPKRQAQGSGFFISSDGYVVTNNHVVEGGEEILIALSNGDELKAKIVGTDPKTDLALLKTEPEKAMPYVAFAPEDNLRIGDWVVAVGNPFGLGGTVTSGIVSARGRDIGAGPYDDFIQIDASINRGNSGGPTFDLAGNVVGVNTAIFSPSGGSVGIGFAIPANVAQDVIADLKEHGSVTRGWLGVSIQPVTPEIAESLGLEEGEGALVADVMKDSPADKSGLETGDVILAIDGKKMKDARDVSRAVADYDPGTEVNFELLREGDEQDVEVVLGEFPEEPRQVAAREGAPAGKVGELGLALTSGPDGGVVVQGVDPQSEAAAKGVRPGDVIVKVNGRTVSNPGELETRIEESGKSSVLLLLRNESGQHFVALSLKDA